MLSKGIVGHPVSYYNGNKMYICMPSQVPQKVAGNILIKIVIDSIYGSFPFLKKGFK